MGRSYSAFFTAVFLAALMAPPVWAQTGEIDTIRARFHEKVGKDLAAIKDMAAVEDIATRLPAGKTLRQRVKIFYSGPRVRYEVEAALPNGEILRFLTIHTEDKAWTITPTGKKAEVDPGAHGSVRPDPIVQYIQLSLGPYSRILSRETFEGKPAVVVDNAMGQTIWLEEESMIPLKMVALNEIGSRGEWIFHNFKRISQVADIPHQVKFTADGAVFHHSVVLLVLNAGLEDSLFDPDIHTDTKPSAPASTAPASKAPALPLPLPPVGR